MKRERCGPAPARHGRPGGSTRVARAMRMSITFPREPEGVAATTERDSAEHRRPRTRDGRSTLPCLDRGCQEKRRRSWTGTIARCMYRERRGEVTPHPRLRSPRRLPFRSLPHGCGRRNPATKAAGPTTMAMADAQARETDGDRLRETPSGHWMQRGANDTAAGEPGAGTVLAEQGGLQRRPSRQAP